MSDIYEGFRCPACGWTQEEGEAGKEYDHCPNCLSSPDDEEYEDGDTCGGIYEPVSIWVREDGAWEIIQRCSWCGDMRTIPMDDSDNPVKLLSIAARPLADPPFPVEKLQEMTALMGGTGDMGGYSHES